LSARHEAKRNTSPFSALARRAPNDAYHSEHADRCTEPDVLIVGTGPTGLVLALWLTRLGVRVRVVDKAAEPGTTSRAVAVQARTLELYRQVGLADAVVDAGRKFVAANLWVAGRRVARAAFGNMGQGLSPYPYALIYPQDEHERLLIDRLAALGVKVERRRELMGFEESSGRVVARLKHADGTQETCEAAYLTGCDGTHSRVREAPGIGLPGGIYDASAAKLQAYLDERGLITAVSSYQPLSESR
jgi:2-polyprenyl-6-methoxyphenol hydroxylase-like FAD-dependent oxidoreductase